LSGETPSASRSPQPSARIADLDLRSPESICAIFRDGAAANREAGCRSGSIDVAEPKGSVLATGDLHDNPVHFARVLELAHLHLHSDEHPRHVTLHEIIHGGSLMSGVDLSHRALARVAALKSFYPEQVHTLLANHELSQIVGLGVVKDGVRMKEAFIHGVEYVFGDDAKMVNDAIEVFIRSMPLAFVSGRGTDKGVLFAHSVPEPALMDRFDAGILDRDLTEDDLEPRRGSAHLMVWGRRHSTEQLEELAERWGVKMFVLGHEHAQDGIRFVPDKAVVLNSDHDEGVVVRLPLDALPAMPPGRANGWEILPLGEDLEF
jgi:hypothetical protein